MSSKLRKVFDCPTLPHQKLQNPLNYYMQLALAQAYQASLLNEVPVGACLVIPATENEEEKVVLGHNQPITQHDPTAHAEIEVLRQAGKIQENYRLNESVLFITLEPCVMCFGAITQARVKHVYFATSEPKKGVYHSYLSLFADRHLNPHTTVSYGLEEQLAKTILQDFFKKKRFNKS